MSLRAVTRRIGGATPLAASAMPTPAHAGTTLLDVSHGPTRKLCLAEAGR